MYLHNNIELFKEIIDQVAEDSGRAAILIEIIMLTFSLMSLYGG